MRIESITIRGFGCLTEQRYEFPEGKAVVIVEENEHGKSTLAAAILAGLCGFPARRASGEVVKLADVYRPWEADVYGVDMEIEAGGRPLRIVRDFAKGTFVVRDRETNRDVRAELDTDLTAHFLQLPRDDFQRIAVVRGKEVERFSSSARLQSRLSALVEGSTDDSGAEVAITALEGATYPLDGKAIKPETAVQRLARAIDEKTRRVNALDTELEAADEDVRALEEGRARQDQLQARIEELDAEYAVARLAEARARIAEVEAAEAEKTALERELASLEEYVRFPADRRDQLTAAAARVREYQQRLNEERARMRGLESEADTIRVSLGSEIRFANASEGDLMALGSAEDSLAQAQRAVSERQSELAAAKTAGSGATGRVMTAIGVLIGLSAVGVWILQLIGVGMSVAGVVGGMLLAAAGLAQGMRTNGRMAGARGRLDEAERASEDAADRSRRRLAAIGASETAGVELGEQIRRAREALARCLADRERLAKAEAALRDAGRAIEGTERRIEDESRAIRSIVGDAGVNPSLALEDALVRFDAAGAKFERYREIRDVLLPALGRRGVTPGVLGQLKAEEERLAAEGGSGGALYPGPSRTSGEAEAERQSIRRELDAARARVVELEREVGLRVEAYRREYPGLREDVRGLRREMEGASRFQKATEAAARVLREVAESSHRRWSAALNEQAAAILPHLNPEYDDLRFDESLAFTVRRARDGRILEKTDVDARLSTGARDQVYLAVRLACCLELSRGGEAVPIILDDPLVASDDARFESAMRYLVERLPETNQVIILSCHRMRHERLTAEEWFGSRTVVVGI